jgi:hypothetical protein
MTELRLVVSGERAAEAADALERELGAGATVERSSPAELPEVERRAIDPISLAALILSISGAVLAAMDLADRIAKRRRAKALIDTAERLRVEKKVEIFVVTVEGSRALRDLSPDALLELASGSGAGT